MVAGVVAEWNPFHNGHEYLLNQIRKSGAHGIAVVLSGNYVQRGEPAVMPVEERVRCALACGADLVAELPLPWSMSTAESFARGAVGLLDSMGIVDRLYFGSESGDLDCLLSAVTAMKDERVNALLREFLGEGITFAKAREMAAARFYPLVQQALQCPNDTLGINYLCALQELQSTIIPRCIKRVGAEHNGAPQGEFASGSTLRRMWREGEDISAYMPKNAWQICKKAQENGLAPVDENCYERTVLGFLRTCSKEKLSTAPSVSEGIENRIYEAVRKAGSLEELFALAKTKRVTHARLRRIAMGAYLGIPAQEEKNCPPYIRVLGFNEKGRELLRTMKETARVPVVVRHADYEKLTEQGKRIYDLQCRGTDLFGLCTPAVQPCGAYQRMNPIIFLKKILTY